MNLHDFFTLQILPGINIGVQYMKYTSEYILKLHIHQHSLLTRKVFSQHNLSAQVFFSISSESSSSPRHLQVIFIWIWIITGSRSSSLDLDHHWIWIISGSRTSLLDHHHGCYLLILLVIGSSTEPALFHVGCRSSLHVGLL